MDIKRGLIEAAHQSRLSRLWPHALAGWGAILTLHRVRPAADEAFQPNRTLEITPAFLDQTIRQIRALDLDIISLTEAHRRLIENDRARRFVCFTLDDGYLDNVTHALPVFLRHQTPFSIFVTTGFLDHKAVFWWLHLEQAIRRESHISLTFDGQAVDYPTATLAEKNLAFHELHHRFRSASADVCRHVSTELIERYDLDPVALCRAQAMSWPMARSITDDGLGTIEAHTVSHEALSRQKPAEIQAEMTESLARIKQETGRDARHFAYPFGDAQAAEEREFDLLQQKPFLTASTMREGMLRPAHAERLTALPRFALNGLYQSPGYVDLVVSGLKGGLSALAAASIRRRAAA